MKYLPAYRDPECWSFRTVNQRPKYTARQTGAYPIELGNRYTVFFIVRNLLKFTRIHTSQYINMKVFFVIMLAVCLYRHNSIWK